MSPSDDKEAEDVELVAKWLWKMDYCKKQGLAPANQSCWELAEQKWVEAQSTKPRTKFPSHQA